jgi:hypothetical protein
MKHPSSVVCFRSNRVKLYRVLANMLGSHSTMWLALPKLGTQGKWRGCTVRRLFDQALTTQHGVERLMKWTNEIHNWGLGPCHDSFLYDVKVVMAGRDDSRAVG